MIAQYFKVSLDQLLGNTPIDDESNLTTNLMPIPVIPWEEAIHAKSFIESLSPQNWDKWMTIDINASPSAFALVSRTTMSPRFPAGSILIFDPDVKPVNGDLVIIHFKGTDNVTIREIVIDGRLKELHSILSDTPAETVSDEHHILGVLIQTRFSYRS